MIRQKAHRHTRWQDIGMPLVLLLTGLILVTFNYLGLLSFDRIQNLWPAAFILTGLVSLVPAEPNRQG